MSAQPLGAILAGGRARRFGNDKASAPIAGRAMLDRVVERLRPQCAGLVVVGRDWPGLVRVNDRPAPDLGPLGGMAGALAHAAKHGFETVLTTSCDIPDLPTNLVALLGAADAIVAGQPTVGHWHASRATALLDWLESGADRSIGAWARHVDARRVPGPGMANINRPEDLAAFRPSADPRSSP